MGAKPDQWPFGDRNRAGFRILDPFVLRLMHPYLGYVSSGERTALWTNIFCALDPGAFSIKHPDALLIQDSPSCLQTG